MLTVYLESQEEDVIVVRKTKDKQLIWHISDHLIQDPGGVTFLLDWAKFAIQLNNVGPPSNPPRQPVVPGLPNNVVQLAVVVSEKEEKKEDDPA